MVDLSATDVVILDRFSCVPASLLLRNIVEVVYNVEVINCSTTSRY